MATEPRHAACFWIPEDYLLDLFCQPDGTLRQYVSVLEPTGIPADANISQVRHDYRTKCFWVLVYHPSLPEWAEGAECPQLGRLAYEHHRVEARVEDEKGRILWARHLLEEVRRLRDVFADLRQDSPAIDAAYRQGVEDAKREAEDERDEIRSLLRDAIAAGYQVDNNTVRAAAGVPINYGGGDGE
jgi:hypothetical protein